MDMRKIIVPLTALAAVALLLPGCHKTPQEPPQNMTMELPATPAKPPAPPVAPPPAPKPKEEKVVVPPTTVAEPSEEEQMREDAEATGMTSRTTGSNGDAASQPAAGGNASQH
jgi:outer membrane biosynthesis protein TonB